MNDKVISIDPGVETGFCYALITDEKMVYYPFQSVCEVDDLWRMLSAFKPRYIIIEDFESRRGSLARGGLNLFPVQLIGVTRLYELLAQHQCASFIQKAAQGKSYWSNDTLKQAGFYLRGKPHAMDASRHLLQWLMFGYGYQFLGKRRVTEYVTMIDSWRDQEE